MARTVSLLCLFLVLAVPQGPVILAQDAKAVLLAVSKNIGADKLQCVTYREQVRGGSRAELHSAR